MIAINKPKVIFYVTLGVLLIVFIMTHDFNDSFVAERGIIHEKRIFALVSDKYRGDHNSKILIVHNYDPDRVWLFRFDTDDSGFYDFIQVGDTIRKDSNSYSIQIIRNPGMDTTWSLWYK